MAEIERKFRLRRLPPAEILGEPEPVVQGYLVDGSAELRVRRQADRCTMTCKSAGQLVREEWETTIPHWVFEHLWPATAGLRVCKTRHEIALNGCAATFDIYGHETANLLILECEFTSKADAEAFRLPPWAQDADDVTCDVRYKNQELARHGPPA